MKNLLVSTCITRKIRRRAIRDYQIGECQNSAYPFNDCTYKSSDLTIHADCKLPLESKWRAFLLNGRKHPRDRSTLGNCLSEKRPQGLAGTTTQFRRKRTIIKKIALEDLGDAEDRMTMGDLFQSLSAQPFEKLDNSLLMTGGAEVTTLARKDQKIFITALPT